MSLFKTDVARLALSMIGASNTVIDLDNGNGTPEKVIRLHLQTSLETLLEKYPWGFATKLEALALVAENPVDGWGFSYSLPADCLVVRAIGDDLVLQPKETYDDERTQWIEVVSNANNLIYTNVAEAKIAYTAKLDVNRAFPNHFGRSWAAQLAMDIAPGIVTNNYVKIKNALIADAEKMINQGISLDINRRPPPPVSDSIFVRAR